MLFLTGGGPGVTSACFVIVDVITLVSEKLDDGGHIR